MFQLLLRGEITISHWYFEIKIISCGTLRRGGTSSVRLLHLCANAKPVKFGAVICLIYFWTYTSWLADWMPMLLGAWVA